MAHRKPHQMLTEREIALEQAACRAENEEEPSYGQSPPALIAAVLRQDTAEVERWIIAAVRATKRCIADGIRNLGPP